MLETNFPGEIKSASTAAHKAQAASGGPVAIAIVTVSDSRTPDTDVNAHYLRAEIAAAGHIVSDYRLIRDEPEQVTAVLDDLTASAARVLLFNGGTGIAPRDTTFDVLDSKLEKKMPGFGELFRMLSWAEVGAAAMLSRATAGVYHNTLIFSTPGSPNAVKLAWEKLIAPELQHMAWEMIRKS
ncbi:MAG: molybdenum cofactor biosynthesis protein MoaB [Ardenticatenaceae bacterium]|nr:molybdenum cofactor biosynthesis protein MoaB [Ardenticatenaceae bacterium]